MVEYAVGRALQHDAALVHHQDPVSRQRLLHEVRDVDDGRTRLVELVHDAHDAAPATHVEQGARLVENQYARLHGKGTGDGHALLLPAGEAAGVGLGVALQRHALELAPYALTNLLGRNAQVLGAKGHILLDDGCDNLIVGILEDKAQLPARPPVCLEVCADVGADELSHQVDQALIGGKQPAEHRRQR